MKKDTAIECICGVVLEKKFDLWMVEVIGGELIPFENVPQFSCNSCEMGYVLNETLDECRRQYTLFLLVGGPGE